MSRVEFERYTERHDDDAYAHAPLVDRASASGVRFRQETDQRLNVLERWQQRVIGGLMFASLMLGGGGIAAVIEFAHK